MVLPTVPDGGCFMAGSISRNLRVVALLVFCATPALATDDRDQGSATVTQSGFDWFANAAKPASKAEATARTRAAILKASGLAKGASWVCSPAGSGRKASCYKG